MRTSRLISAALAAFLLTTGVGCGSLFHNLKPHRLWRLNRHSSPMASGSGVYYSVPDPPIERHALPELGEMADVSE